MPEQLGLFDAPPAKRKRNPMTPEQREAGRLAGRRAMERKYGANPCIHCGAITRGKTKQCKRCAASAAARKTSTTHGLSKTVEFRLWSSMKQRCRDPRAWCWSRYGGRGISVCERWASSFVAFLEDMGTRPSPKHSLDRIDNDGNYEPGNVRWATIFEQGSNRSDNVRVEIDGETLTVAEWARRVGISRTAMGIRFANWEKHEAVTAVARRTVRGATHKLAKLNAANVVDIRARRASGVKLSVLANEYGVSQALISKIALGKNWKHTFELEPDLAGVFETRTRRAR